MYKKMRGRRIRYGSVDGNFGGIWTSHHQYKN